jgi:hypothetical protein
MFETAEMRGSCKTLILNIEMMRKAMCVRGPWKRSIGLRGYHDELLHRLARKPFKKYL